MRSDLFKYTPFYKEEMSIIYKAIKESDRLLIRAPPGSGKTTAAIVYAIERALSGERTAIFLRTENEIYKAVRILKTILNKSGIKVKWSFVMGKEKLCVFKNLKVLNLSNELYRFVCFSSGCRLRYKTGSIDLNSVEPEEAYDELCRSGFCPYYSLIDIAKDSKILIGQHNQIMQFIHTFDNLIIDEAHSSQSGIMARKMKQVLSTNSLEEAETLDSEDMDEIDEEILKEIESYRDLKNISFFAFTATPKSKTLEMFGIPDEYGHYHPFHTYTMKQAIGEGFILDVLKNYVTYATYFKLVKKIHS